MTSAGSRPRDGGRRGSSRWWASAGLGRGLKAGYGPGAGGWAEDWKSWAGIFDLFNLASLLRGVEPGSRRSLDVTARMKATFEGVEWRGLF